MLHGALTIVGIKKILPEVWTLAGGTVAAGSITAITQHDKTADEFNGGLSGKWGLYEFSQLKVVTVNID